MQKSYLRTRVFRPVVLAPALCGYREFFVFLILLSYATRLLESLVVSSLTSLVFIDRFKEAVSGVIGRVRSFFYWFGTMGDLFYGDT